MMLVVLDSLLAAGNLPLAGWGTEVQARNRHEYDMANAKTKGEAPKKATSAGPSPSVSLSGRHPSHLLLEPLDAGVAAINQSAYLLAAGLRRSCTAMASASVTTSAAPTAPSPSACTADTSATKSAASVRAAGAHCACRIFVLEVVR